MGIQINRVTNAKVYANGNSMVGKADEVKLPDITAKMAEYKGLGMIGAIELPAGFEKMEGEIKWSSFYEDVFKMMANPYKNAQIQVRANLETFAGEGRTEEKPLVVFMTVAFKKTPAGTMKHHDNAEYPGAFVCYYIKMQLDGADVLEFDPLNNIYKVDGVDLLEGYNANT